MIENCKGKILYVGGFELPDRNAAAHRVLNNAKIFRLLNFQVVFCGIDKSIVSFSNEPKDVDGFESYPIPYPSSLRSWIRQMIDIKQYLMILKKYENIKLVIAYNLHAFPLSKLLRYCHKHHIKVAVDCTEWYQNKISFNPIKFVKYIDTVLCMKRYQKKCDGMIAISRYLEEYYKKYISNIIVVPPLVDLEDRKYQNLSEKEKTDKIRFVYCGSPAVTKEALGNVVACFNNLEKDNFIFRIVGITQEQFVKMYGVTPKETKIFFEGRISHTEALNIVRQSEYAIIIRPKNRVTQAGFPTKFVEAISCGTAVIANDTSDLKLFLKDEKNGYIVKEDNLEEEMTKILHANSIPVIEKKLFDYHRWEEPFKNFIAELQLL
jgi:hypothetical protein